MSEEPEPDKDGKSPSEAHVSKTVEDRFLGVTLKGWAISAISSVAVLTALGSGFFTVYGKYKSLDTVVGTKIQENGDLTATISHLSDQLKPIETDTKQKLTEADKHRRNRDRYETYPIDQDPEIVTAEYYPSDGCIHIIRKLPPGNVSFNHNKSKNKVFYGSNIQDSWILDPSRAVDSLNLPSSKLNPDTLAVDLSQINPGVSKLKTSDAGMPHLLSASMPSLKKAGMFEGSCLNPHPGVFQIRNQQVSACDVQVWRYFPDGCTHYQMYNACNGQWTSNPVWTACSIQHRW